MGKREKIGRPLALCGFVFLIAHRFEMVIVKKSETRGHAEYSGGRDERC